MKLIIKIFPEILLKSRSVRKLMCGQLQRNLLRLLTPVDKTIKVRSFWDKIEVNISVEASDEIKDEVRTILGNTPGIDQVLEVVQSSFTDMDDLAKKTANWYLPLIKGKTFVVRCKRTGKHDFRSIDVERHIGAWLLKHGEPASVNLTAPDIKVELEVLRDEVNIVKTRTRGLGGFPMGSQGVCLSLVSGGFDSSVASYHVMRRGLVTHFLFFNLGGRAHETGVKQVAWFLWNKFSSTHKVKFITVPFESVVAEILETVDDGYMGIVLKRLMFRVADEVAAYMKIDALVTGESIAQVSSQTLRNLALIDKVTDKLVIRPLATMDKTSIIATAAKIGTREFAENMPEYCGVISVKPNVHGKFSRVAEIESAFDMSVLRDAINNRSSVLIDSIIDDIIESSPCRVVNDPDGYTVIDIRRDIEQQQQPIKTNCTQLHIPFSRINHEFPALSSDQEYLLYCSKGVMSQLHTQYLNDAGFNNVGVYRPDK